MGSSVLGVAITTNSISNTSKKSSRLKKIKQNLRKKRCKQPPKQQKSKGQSKQSMPINRQRILVKLSKRGQVLNSAWHHIPIGQPSSLGNLKTSYVKVRRILSMRLKKLVR